MGRSGTKRARLFAGKGVLESGDVRAIAVTRARARALPDVPTVAEQGFPRLRGDELDRAGGTRRHAGAILTRWNGEMRKALSGPEITARLAVEGSERVGSTPAEFHAKLGTELERWSGVVYEERFEVD